MPVVVVRHQGTNDDDDDAALIIFGLLAAHEHFLPFPNETVKSRAFVFPDARFKFLFAFLSSSFRASDVKNVLMYVLIVLDCLF